MPGWYQKNVATVILTVLALMAFAGNSVLCRVALGQSTIDPASYTAVRLTSGAVTLWLISGVLRARHTIKSRGSWTSAAMLFLYATAFSFAYVSLSAGTGALILFATVQITMISGGLYSGERPSGLEWSGLATAILGLIYLLSPAITAPSPLGSTLMATAGVAWGIYSLQGRGATDPVGATTDNFLRTLPLAFIIVLLWLPRLELSPAGLLWAVLSGSVTSALGYVAWYAALRGLTGTRAATVQLSVPVVAMLGGVVFLSEEITWRLFASAVAILGGIGLAASGGTLRAEAPAGKREFLAFLLRATRL